MSETKASSLPSGDPDLDELLDRDSPLGKLRAKFRMASPEDGWTLRLNGHFKSAAGMTKRLEKRLWSDLRTNFVIGLFKPVAGDEDKAEVGPRFDMRCYNCEEKIGFLLDAKDKSVTASTMCQMPNGQPPFKVRVNVPSGKLLFANDLRAFLGVNDGYDVNWISGQRQTTEAYAAHGMIHISVGNICPGIYQSSNENVIRIATTKEDVKPKPHEPKLGKRLGAICTDLWWFCAIDFEFLKSLVKDEKLFSRIEKDAHTTIVSVEPGMYTATSYSHLVRDDSVSMALHSEQFDLEAKLSGKDLRGDKVEKATGEEAEKIKVRLAEIKKALKEDRNSHAIDVFATIERTGDCGEIPEHAALLREFDPPSFEEAIALSAMAYPEIYPSRASVVDHYFLVIGNGLEWEKGALFSVSSENREAKRRYDKGERPVWRGERRSDGTLYPTCGYSAIFTVPDDVRIDWLMGVYEAVNMLLALDHTKKSSSGHENATNIAHGRLARDLLDRRFEGVDYDVQRALQFMPDRWKTRAQVLVSILCDSTGDWEWRKKYEHDDAKADTPGGPTMEKIRFAAQKRGAYPLTGPGHRRARRLSKGEPVAWDGPEPVDDFAMVALTESSLACNVPKNVPTNWLIACVEALDYVINSKPLPTSNAEQREKTIALAKKARARLEKRFSEPAKKVWTPKKTNKTYGGDLPIPEGESLDDHFEDREIVLTAGDEKRRSDIGYYIDSGSAVSLPGVKEVIATLNAPKTGSSAFNRWRVLVWLLANKKSGCRWRNDGTVAVMVKRPPKVVGDYASIADIEGSPVAKVPDNVDGRWLAACVEALEAIVDKAKNKAAKNTAERKATVKIAKETLRGLCKRLKILSGVPLD